MKYNRNRRGGATGRRLGVAVSCAVLIAMLAASCWHPTFDPMISASEVTVKKLGDPLLYFSIKDVQKYGMEDAWFLPQNSSTPSSGVLVMEMTDKLAFKSFPSIDVLNHTATISQTTGFERVNALGDAHLVHADPNGNSNFIVVPNRTSGESWMMLPLTLNGSVTPPALTDGPFGIGVVAQDSTGQATVACFIHPLPSTSQYETVSWSTGSPSFSGPSVLIFTSGDQATVPGKFPANTTHLYLSCGLSDGSRAIFRWDTATANTVDAIRYPEDFGPLIGALSDGRLLAEENGIVSVLDENLTRLFKFPAGTLRFVHERWNGSIMKVVFTRSLFVRNSNHDDNGTLQVEVYEIPTANLIDLAD